MFIADGETIPQTYESQTINAVNTLTTSYAANAGEIIAKNIEYMRVQLVVRNTNGTTRTLGVNDYKAITTLPRPAVIGVNLGWLVRSSEKVAMAEKTDFKVLDQTITATKDGYMRQVYTTTIAIRNGGLGDI